MNTTSPSSSLSPSSSSPLETPSSSPSSSSPLKTPSSSDLPSSVQFAPSSSSVFFPASPVWAPSVSPSSVVVDHGLIIPQIAAILFVCILLIATIFRKNILKIASNYNRNNYNVIEEYQGEFPSDLPAIDVFANDNVVPETELTETEMTETNTETFNSSEV